MTDPAAEFQSLLNQRELAAVRAVSMIGQVLDFWEASDYESAKAALTEARDQYRDADRKVSQFRKTHKGASPNGNRSAA